METMTMEAKLKEKYNISSLYPSVWPAEKDQESDDDEEESRSVSQALPTSLTIEQPQRRASKSHRYSVLGAPSSLQKKIPGAEKTRDGVENMVQKDESDPLGTFPSVVQVLRQKGLPVEEDIRLRNRFLLSSTTFSPSLFLSQVHDEASTDSLLSGLDFLSRSIEKKSASLKVLVESNFERFVSAKATIDRVYSEMRDADREEVPPVSMRRPSHGRHASRSSFSARKPSASMLENVPSEKKRKNALVKESEYGVQGIKVPLTEVAVKAEEVWGPAINSREKEETLQSILATVEKNRGLFEVGSAIQDAIRRRDHESIVEEYTRARKYAEEARYHVTQATYNGASLSDTQIHQIIVTARMWADVEHQIEAFKRDCWKRLTTTHFTKSASEPEEAKSEQYLGLISIMLELGVEDNPIWIWLLSRHEYLKSRLQATCERSRVEIEILRRHLATQQKPSLRLFAKYLHAVPLNNNVGLEPAKLDAPKAIEFWEHVNACMMTLLSADGGLLGEVVEFWEIAQSFVHGRAQRNLPMGFNNQSSVHHTLSSSNITQLEKGVVELVNTIREHIFGFFSDPPIDDISLLFSPMPNTPTPTTPRTPMSAALSPAATRFRFDPNNVPPPSPSRGETWEKYAFWPPHSNALSGSHYLSKVLILVGTAANEMASLRLPETGSLSRIDDSLRMLVGAVRERCVQAVCAAWNTDAENLKVLEDWTRDPVKGITNMPARFLAIQTLLLTNLQRIMYVSGSEGSRAGARKSGVDVVVPPSSKLLQMVKSQFVTSFYRTLSGMVECAEKGQRALGKDFDTKGDDLTITELTGEDEGWGRVDADQLSTRLLLTLSNMQSLEREISPHLLSTFETLFSVALPDESARIKDVLNQLDAQLFRSYTKPHSTRITNTITTAIENPDWAPEPLAGKSVAEREPSPFVFTVLLDLVLVHTEVSTTSPALTSRILRSLFEQSTFALIDVFRSLPDGVRLAALMQATLDVEFMAQTLSAYTTDKASAVQTDIYQVLDKKTSNEARTKLQEELGLLRGVLKRLREGTRVQFMCFRRVRREGTVGGGAGGGGGGNGRDASSVRSGEGRERDASSVRSY